MKRIYAPYIAKRKKTDHETPAEVRRYITERLDNYDLGGESLKELSKILSVSLESLFEEEGEKIALLG